VRYRSRSGGEAEMFAVSVEVALEADAVLEEDDEDPKGECGSSAKLDSHHPPP
jgi:hypothetical protein